MMDVGLDIILKPLYKKNMKKMTGQEQSTHPSTLAKLLSMT